jgi:hypothetical protein
MMYESVGCKKVKHLKVEDCLYFVLLCNLIHLVCCLALFLLSLEECNFIISPFCVLFRVWVKYNPQNVVFTMSCLL